MTLSFFILFSSMISLEGSLVIMKFILIFFLFFIPWGDFVCLINSLSTLDFTNWSIYFLTVEIMILSFMSVQSNMNKCLLLIMNLNSMFFVLTVFFFISSIMVFYVFFELSLIPILLMILGWGYQVEREAAGYALIFYTVSASMPLLITILMMLHSSLLKNFFQLFSLENSNNSTFFLSTNLMTLTMIFAFLVKFPLFFFHLWLPKAHVEAPAIGSMILAAILLKMGGVGILRFMNVKKTSIIFNSLFIWSIFGAIVISFICVQLLDLKMIIAYSSVAHMGLVISASLMSSAMGEMGGVMLMIAHGFTSSLMFFLANLMYISSNTRSMPLMKGILQISPLISLFWFLSMVGSMAGPPSINLASEILSFVAILSISSKTSLAIFFSAFFAAAYSLLMYAAVSQPSFLSYSLNIFKSQVFLLVALIHSLYIFLLAISLNMMYMCINKPLFN